MNTTDFRRKKLEDLINEYKESGKAKSVAALARLYDLDTSYISQLRKGYSSFGESAARNLEAKMGLPHRYFEPNGMENENLPAKTTSLMQKAFDMAVTTNTPKLVKIPRLDARLACGDGYFNAENPDIIGYDEFPEEYLKSRGMPADGHGLYILLADGDSMYPTIPDKTPLGVNTNERDFDRLVTGKVYAFCANGSVICKKVIRNLDGSIVLRSDNPDKTAYADQEVTKEKFEEFIMIGRVKVGLVDF